MTENGNFKVSSVLSPLTASLTNSSLQDLDPVLYQLIHFFSGVIDLHILDRWNLEVSNLGMSNLIDNAIAEVLPYDPLPISTEDQFKFPLLCAYRSEESFELKSETWYSINSEIEVVYILPPLASNQLKALYPFLTHVSRVFADRTFEGLDSNFESGKQVWNIAGLDTIGMKSCSYGKVNGVKEGLKSNLYFPAISCKFDCSERRMIATENFEPFSGFDGYETPNYFIDKPDGSIRIKT